MLADRLARAAEGERLRLPDISPRSKFRAVVKAAVKHKTVAEVREEKRERMMMGYIGAMNANADLAAVQEEAMIALCAIIDRGDAIRTLVRTGGLDCIVFAMTLHLGNVEIQTRGATALARVALTSAPCRCLLYTSPSPRDS